MLSQVLSNGKPAVVSRGSVVVPIVFSFVVKILPNFGDSRSSPGFSDLITELVYDSFILIKIVQ